MCVNKPTQELEKSLTSSEIDWEYFVQLSSEHLVLTTAYCRLEQKELLNYLPKELVDYLEEITNINRNRNLALLNEIKAIAICFNEHNIPYVFLKGAALLIGGYCKDLGERMISDLDILIPNEYINHAYKLIQSLGYDQEKNFNYSVKNFRHLARQFSNSKLAAIELHHSVVNTNCAPKINYRLIFDTSEKVDNIYIPNTYYLNLITIIGVQTNSNGYRYKQWFLRSLSDSLTLKLSHETQLIEDFKHDKIVKDYLSKLYTIFNCCDIKPTNVTLTKLNRRYLFRINHIGYHKFSHKVKFIYYNITERITLFFNNKSYRNHCVNSLRSKLNR
ncbi:nucleotidyltransferase family protein [Psychroserpens damuponensis]|uniref:nucleotidyltransferase family protein n=1 Tax=Psychroserpens damuponensis TaxID=943936 RepID=UPI0013791EB5|nr:nucleotidyltransferase family protein [Psychroserpens damuponensis]